MTAISFGTAPAQTQPTCEVIEWRTATAPVMEGMPAAHRESSLHAIRRGALALLGLGMVAGAYAGLLYVGEQAAERVSAHTEITEMRDNALAAGDADSAASLGEVAGSLKEELVVDCVVGTLCVMTAAGGIVVMHRQARPEQNAGPVRPDVLPAA